MAIFKCKMCGGDLEIAEGMSVAECTYCGTQQTLPKLDDDKKTNLYDRAGHFRRNNEYDKAMSIYEKILEEDKTDAEAYWSLVLCKYGVEYVEDPATRKRVPTINRAQYTSVFADENYKSAIEYADLYQKDIYESEAKVIDDIQKGILEISNKEEPFEVFICYKETDANGRRTPDSVLATDLYHQLTNEGFKVFFSRITLEDKLGTAYEPYIFAALNSAKVMVVLGTKPEYFNAVWVKNEWSRYLALIKNSKNKVLIPAYKDMDPYDLPEEFSHLQAQDMSKLGFMQDLIRGIKKITVSDTPKQDEKETVVVNSGSANLSSLLRRVSIFLEDGDWKAANEYCEKVLDIEPENSQAYIGKLMADLKLHKQAELGVQRKSFSDNGNFKKALRFADESTSVKLKQYEDRVKKNVESDCLEQNYNNAINTMTKAKTEDEFKTAAKMFESLGDYKNAKTHVEKCMSSAEDVRNKLIAAEQEKKKAVEKHIEYIKDIELEIEQLKNDLANERNIILDNVKNVDNKIKDLNGKLEALGIFKIKEKNVIKDEIARYEKENSMNNIKLSSVENEYDGKIKQKAMVALYEFRRYSDYEDFAKKCDALTDFLNYRELVSAGLTYTVGIKKDGTVIAAGSNDDHQCDVSSWRDIVAISAGNHHTVALKKDGTVIAAGKNEAHQCDVSSWKDIVAVSAGYDYTVGLKKDGTVVAVGRNSTNQCDVKGWRDIVAISAGAMHTVGLKKDGTVVATGANTTRECEVGSWKDIVAVSAGFSTTAGLKKDGTVVAIGRNNYHQCDVSDWKDIAAISTSGEHTVGLKRNGNVVAVGNNKFGQCDAKYFVNIGIVAVSTHGGSTVVLKKDGTVSTVGVAYGVSDWKDIKVPLT